VADGDRCRLYLVTPPALDLAVFPDTLARALDAGDVAAVQSAVDAAAQVVGQKGMLVNKVVIPHPRPELLNEMI